MRHQSPPGASSKLSLRVEDIKLMDGKVLVLKKFTILGDFLLDEHLLKDLAVLKLMLLSEEVVVISRASDKTILLREDIADELGGVSNPNLAGGNNSIGRDNATGPDNTAGFNLHTIKDSSTHTNDNIIGNSASMDSSTVTDSNIVPNHSVSKFSINTVLGDMDGNVVLNVGVVTNFDTVDVTAKNSAIPNGGLGTDLNITKNVSIGSNESTLGLGRKNNLLHAQNALSRCRNRGYNTSLRSSGRVVLNRSICKVGANRLLHSTIAKHKATKLIHTLPSTPE
mmetsp:Transcript_30271/g.55296  ORF Transcript_30271/g.55296 Transcript_30271/m.55296 type:complete len:282 (-) Transcript_30271:187-1032(-)